MSSLLWTPSEFVPGNSFACVTVPKATFTVRDVELQLSCPCSGSDTSWHSFMQLLCKKLVEQAAYLSQ